LRVKLDGKFRLDYVQVECALCPLKMIKFIGINFIFVHVLYKDLHTPTKFSFEFSENLGGVGFMPG